MSDPPCPRTSHHHSTERCREGLCTRHCKPNTHCQSLPCTKNLLCHRIRSLLFSLWRAKHPCGAKPCRSSSWLVPVCPWPPVVVAVFGQLPSPLPTVPLRAGDVGLTRAHCIRRAGQSGQMGLCVLTAGGSLSCCIDPHRGRNMCAMHRSMGRLKMCVCLPDDWGKLCRWHRQHSEGHTDLRRSPRERQGLLLSSRGAVSSLFSRDPSFPARHAPPQQSHVF